MAAAANQDIPASLALVDPDVVWIPLRATTEGEYRGHAGFERFVADTSATFESFEPRFAYRELTPDRVLAWGEISVRGRGSGAETEVRTGGVFELRDGRIARWQDFGSKEGALASLQAVDVVRLLYGAFNRGDLDEFLTYWDPDCTYHSAVHQLLEGDAAAFRGHDGIRRWWDDLHALYEDLRTELRETSDLGDEVLVEFEISGRGAGSGILGAETLGQLVTVSGGRVLAARDYPSREDALTAQG
jgi:ketosteroid isomerase-like protein